MTIELIEKYLMKVYSKDTCYPKDSDRWNLNNPTLGHCAIVSLILNDYLGGQIYKTKVGEVSHYFNYISDEIVDLTASQFNGKIDYSNKVKKDRDEIIKDSNTLFRYNLLKTRFELLLIDDEIHNCNLCSNMIEKFPNSKTVSIGKKNDS